MADTRTLTLGDQKTREALLHFCDQTDGIRMLQIKSQLRASVCDSRLETLHVELIRVLEIVMPVFANLAHTSIVKPEGHIALPIDCLHRQAVFAWLASAT